MRRENLPLRKSPCPCCSSKGFYEVKGSQPDGDTVHFTADDPIEWNLVGGGGGRAVEHNVLGRAALRLDAIDALETHYGPEHLASALLQHLPVIVPPAHVHSHQVPDPPG
ncbi:hypothetical protein [Streptomyces sp. NPDC054783]